MTLSYANEDRLEIVCCAVIGILCSVVSYGGIALLLWCTNV